VAITNFIPEIWSARLLSNLHKALVYGQGLVVNRNYEGEIRSVGDTVRITSIGAVTIGDYTKNSTIGEPEVLTDSQKTLEITESKFFHFFVDDVDRIQAAGPLMDEAMAEAAYGLANVADQFIADMYLDAEANNLVGDDTTPVVPTATSAYELLVDLSVKLDEANVPEEGRWVIVPPWYHGLMLKDDRFTKAGTVLSDGRLMNGRVGEAAGFHILKSNNVPNTSGAKYKITAGTRMAYSFAEQVNQVEAYRPEKRFGDAVKGLHLYGGKTVRPQAIAVLTANKPSGGGS